jgi:hypothetical protein
MISTNRKQTGIYRREAPVAGIRFGSKERSAAYRDQQEDQSKTK